MNAMSMAAESIDRLPIAATAALTHLLATFLVLSYAIMLAKSDSGLIEVADHCQALQVVPPGSL